MKKADGPVICPSPIPTEKQMRLSKRNYFPTASGLASVSYP